MPQNGHFLEVLGFQCVVGRLLAAFPSPSWPDNESVWGKLLVFEDGLTAKFIRKVG